MAEIHGSRHDPAAESVATPTAQDKSAPADKAGSRAGATDDVLAHRKDRAEALTHLERSARLGTSDLEQDTDLPEPDPISPGPQLKDRKDDSRSGGARTTDEQRARVRETDHERRSVVAGHGALHAQPGHVPATPTPDRNVSEPVSESSLPERTDEAKGRPETVGRSSLQPDSGRESGGASQPNPADRASTPTKAVESAAARRDLPAAERYGGELIRTKQNDPAAVALAERLGGKPSMAFDSDPSGREFDTISDLYVAQSKPANLTYGSRFRNQARETFEASLATNRTPYFHFETEPDRDVIRKLHDYERRYKIRAIIDTEPLGD